MARDQHGPDDAFRITTAASSRNADIAARQKRYLLSMGIRSVCFVAAVTISILEGPPVLVWVLIAAALVLPYVAVVMANATETRDDGFVLRDGAHQRPELLTGTPTERDTRPRR